MTKPLVAYGTRKGMAAETAKVIANVLREKYSMESDVFNLKKAKNIDLAQYQTIVIGSGIAIGRWTRHALKFLKNDFTDKKVFVYVCSAEAGEALENNEQDKYQEAERIISIIF